MGKYKIGANNERVKIFGDVIDAVDNSKATE